MTARWCVGGILGIVLIPLILAGTLVGAAPVSSAPTCVNWTGFQPPNPSTSYNILNAVVFTSPCRAWAVGYSNDGSADQTLIEHWKGTFWKQVPSPNPVGAFSGNVLNDVAATSASNA
jgi:hypothetical protein